MKIGSCICADAQRRPIALKKYPLQSAEGISIGG